MTAPGVLVLGMHRSGTSAVTRALALLGLDAGRPAAMMEAAPSNRSGHWELADLTAFNDRLLRDVGGRWSGPPTDGGRLADAAAGPLGDAARALADELLPTGPWVWKDPRLCLTLPFWREVLGERPTTAVVCLRHPLEVAASLGRRNGLIEAYGVALWERYLRSLWADIGGRPALVVAYDAAVDRPADTVDALAGFVEQRTGVTPSARARDDAVGSLDGGQRHHEVDVEVRSPVLSEPQQQLFEWSLSLVGTHDALPAPDLGPETPGLQLAFDEHTRMAEFEDETLRLRAGIDQARAEEQAKARADLDRHTLFFHQELERRSAEASMLANDVMAARAQVADLQATLDHIRRRPPVRAYLAVRRRLARPRR